MVGSSFQRHFDNKQTSKNVQTHYRPISLLSVVYKILVRLILQRIQPLIDAAIPVSQAGFGKNRNCTEQVMALTSHIEAGFERKLKTGTIFIDLILLRMTWFAETD
jgi:hypothetical protein